MTDHQIIQAALQAGLCFPICWYLIDPENPEKDITDEFEEPEQNQMNTLRKFAELIKSL